jgi:hypothetical protein
VDETAADLADDHAAAAAADATAEPSAMPSATGDAPSEGPSEAVRAVRARFPEPPREGSLRKPEPGQGLALLGIVACAWAPFILWWFFGPIALILGVLAYRKGEKRAKWLVLAAVVCTIAGAIIMALPDRWVTS